MLDQHMSLKVPLGFGFVRTKLAEMLRLLSTLVLLVVVQTTSGLETFFTVVALVAGSVVGGRRS